jgi:hypothetical protein
MGIENKFPVSERALEKGERITKWEANNSKAL